MGSGLGNWDVAWPSLHTPLCPALSPTGVALLCHHHRCSWLGNGAGTEGLSSKQTSDEEHPGISTIPSEFPAPPPPNSPGDDGNEEQHGDGDANSGRPTGVFPGDKEAAVTQAAVLYAAGVAVPILG